MRLRGTLIWYSDAWVGRNSSDILPGRTSVLAPTRAETASMGIGGKHTTLELTDFLDIEL